jgi:tubulin polyglutamylase TTLL1
LNFHQEKKKYNFREQIVPRMKEMATDAARSVFTKIAPRNQMNNFEILGLDFMIDKDFEPWLIEVNTNPCLDCSSPLLNRIIPYMVEQTFKLTLDLAHPPPSHYPNTCKHLAPLVQLETFKYELIFDSQHEGAALTQLYTRVRSNFRNF